jgi:hypothetical protein
MKCMPRITGVAAIDAELYLRGKSVISGMQSVINDIYQISD